MEGAKLCTRYLPRHEREYGIPEHLLAAIASTESGRFHRALGLNLPWPWTINVEGAGYFFDTKEEAISAVRSFQDRGIVSIDVGCMQVNLMHHPNAFASLDQAFDPGYNVAYAAQFLKQNFQEEGSWRKATADYHSRTPTYGEQYANLVYGAWERIINKVADARAGRPILNASATRYAASQASAHSRIYHPPHFHDISVARETTREHGVLVVRPESDEHDNGILIVRPEYASSPDVMQQASLADNFVSSVPAAKPSPERSAIDPTGTGVIASGDEVSRGAQIVKIQPPADSGTKGQFQPSVHVVHVGENSSSASTSSTASSTAVTAPDSSGKNTFIFNN